MGSSALVRLHKEDWALTGPRRRRAKGEGFGWGEVIAATGSGVSDSRAAARPWAGRPLGPVAAADALLEPRAASLAYSPSLPKTIPRARWGPCGHLYEGSSARLMLRHREDCYTPDTPNGMVMLRSSRAAAGATENTPSGSTG